ncbi:hypothetical protein LY474_32880 [Myxococcus stipitatus]|uniref:hypothetical protein n=1 Tax=Myxococcus stipitatus TaxID=83455 RepID=UPI001F2E7355|nr:hypothetical protein [Myxococcus stipitatus]MCE9672613.1 hypothetical protein [Myxococcus stipitatus]
MHHVRVALSVTFVVLAFQAWAGEGRPTFYMVFKECKALGVAAQLGAPSTTEAQGYSLECWRSGKKVSCLFVSEGEQKQIQYTVDADIPPLLILVQGQSAGDFISINTSRHSASSMTRILLDDGGLVAKVCSGVYATADEVTEMRAAEAKPQSSPEPLRAVPAAPSTVEPASTSAPARSCCKVCTNGCPCGDACISCNKTCRKGPGCAC